jgi:molybdate transport system substrate-binding protein
MKKGLYLIIVFLLFSACQSKKASEQKEVVVYCAASLTDIVTELAKDFETETNVRIKLNLASSGTLARQIEHGAIPAIFISANKEWLAYLDSLELTVPKSGKRIAGNQLVLVAPLNSEIQPFDFSGEVYLPKLFEGRLSIGDPQHVPAGMYAVQALKNLGYETEFESRFLPAKDVRSALMVVEMGEADAGIVYKTDALKSGKVKIVTQFPDSLYEPVSYYMALIKGAENDRSLQLYNYLVSEKASPVWAKYGFIP